MARMDQIKHRYPDKNYRAAMLVLERMRRYRRFLTRPQMQAIRDQALSGDVDGANRGLGELLLARWE